MSITLVSLMDQLLLKIVQEDLDFKSL